MIEATGPRVSNDQECMAVKDTVDIQRTTEVSPRLRDERFDQQRNHTYSFSGCEMIASVKKYSEIFFLDETKKSSREEFLHGCVAWPI